MNSLPETIYLVGASALDPEGDLPLSSDICWCNHPVEPGDPAYVLETRVKPIAEVLRKFKAYLSREYGRSVSHRMIDEFVAQFGYTELQVGEGDVHHLLLTDEQYALFCEIAENATRMGYCRGAIDALFPHPEQA